MAGDSTMSKATVRLGQYPRATCASKTDSIDTLQSGILAVLTVWFMHKPPGQIIMMRRALKCILTICRTCTLSQTVFAVAGKFVREYIDATVPEMAFGEVRVWLSRGPRFCPPQATLTVSPILMLWVSIQLHVGVDLSNTCGRCGRTSLRHPYGGDSRAAERMCAVLGHVRVPGRRAELQSGHAQAAHRQLVRHDRRHSGGLRLHHQRRAGPCPVPWILAEQLTGPGLVHACVAAALSLPGPGDCRLRRMRLAAPA